MIKTVLVPTSGSRTDESVFATALAVARPFAAHLQFLHVHVALAEAVVNTPHADFCQGAAIADTLQRLQQRGEHLAADARGNFQRFCGANGVRIKDAPDAVKGVSASWTVETNESSDRLLFHARHNDLVVLGRAHNRNFMPSGLIESLLVGCGRPVIIAPETPPSSLTGTIVVGWKETPAAARALTAALPLLESARRVVLLTIAEDGAPSAEALDDLARQLVWHGIRAEVHLVAEKSGPATLQLPRAAAHLQADLLVVGGFGHRPLRELVFGGVTQSLIDAANFPVFLLH